MLFDTTITLVPSSCSLRSTMATMTASKQGGGKLLSVNVESDKTGSHKINLSFNLPGGGKPAAIPAEAPPMRALEDTFDMAEAMAAAEEDVDEETAARNLAGRESVLQRLMRGDPQLGRIDICAALFAEVGDFNEFLAALASNPIIEVVHLSGLGQGEAVHADDFKATVEAVGKMPNLKELFVFRGTSRILNEELLSKCISMAKNLKVLMIWGYDESLVRFPVLAGVLRQHANLERVTITMSSEMPYTSMDIYAMAFASMSNLQCLNLRVNGHQTDAIMSPEAASILFSSTTIESIYLENLGLTDDHTDAIFEELRNTNKTLKSCDLKTNSFTDDAIYTLAQILPHNKTLTSVDLSGVQITDGAGQALAKALAHNSVIEHLELEGTLQRFRDEFDIPAGHEDTPWMKEMDYQIRLNRAGDRGNRKKFVEALNSVSDHLQCLFALLRESPQYCDRTCPDVLPDTVMA